MSKTLIYNCKEDHILPAELHQAEIIKVECKGCIGYVDVTDEFEYTRNGNTYKFTYEGEYNDI